MDSFCFDFSHLPDPYTGSNEADASSCAFFPEQGTNGDFHQLVWPTSTQSTPDTLPPSLYFSNADSVALPFTYDNRNVQMPPAFTTGFQPNVEAFNSSQYFLNHGYIGAASLPVNGMQYSDLAMPASSAGAAVNGQENVPVQLPFNTSPFVAYPPHVDYFPIVENGSYGFRQATFHSHYPQDSTPANIPLHFAQPCTHGTTPTDYPRDAQATNHTRWVNLDPSAVKNGFKTPARNATRAPAKKAPAKSSKGIKKPRYKVSYKDRELLFRSCVTKLSDRCFWEGCKDVVFTDRKSITEHMDQVHGLDITEKARVGCRWKSCKRNLKTESVFRHITNSHMHVVEAPCLYGCGEVFSRVDGRTRHMLTCSNRPDEN